MVGKLVSRPALDHVGHAYALSFVGGNLFGLFFCGDEENLLALFCYLFESFGSFFELGGSLVKIENVDTIALHEDVGSHSGVPFALEVAEVATCFKELIKSGCSHFL